VDDFSSIFVPSSIFVGVLRLYLAIAPEAIANRNYRVLSFLPAQIKFFGFFCALFTKQVS